MALQVAPVRAAKANPMGVSSEALSVVLSEDFFSSDSYWSASYAAVVNKSANKSIHSSMSNKSIQSLTRTLPMESFPHKPVISRQASTVRREEWLAIKGLPQLCPTNSTLRIPHLISHSIRASPSCHPRLNHNMMAVHQFMQDRPVIIPTLKLLQVSRGRMKSRRLSLPHSVRSVANRRRQACLSSITCQGRQQEHIHGKRQLQKKPMVDGCRRFYGFHGFCDCDFGLLPGFVSVGGFCMFYVCIYIIFFRHSFHNPVFSVLFFCHQRTFSKYTYTRSGTTMFLRNLYVSRAGNEMQLAP